MLLGIKFFFKYYFYFSTIWFELLTNEFPFSCLPSDSILWQVGTGMKSPLNDVNACVEAKVNFILYCYILLLGYSRIHKFLLF